MSTEWLPLIQIPFEQFKNNLPPSIQIINDKCRFDKGIVLTDGTSYLHCGPTETNGTIIEQFGANQKHYDIIKLLGEHFNTKFMSYVGEPYEDEEVQKYNYNDLEIRDYPSLK